MREHPIQSVTEPMQYRAIGVVRGIYKPEDDEKFTRGRLIDIHGEEIDSVVLGRVITLMKRHLIVEDSHLWVVYPRCREPGNLHLQITGIWEPSTLSKTSLNNNDFVDLHTDLEDKKFDELPEGDDYFSIRGDLIYTKPENNEFIIKIRQRPRSNKRSLPFKLILEGEIPIEYIRNFVSLKVRRKGQKLVLEEYQVIGKLPKRSAKNRNSTIKVSKK